MNQALGVRLVSLGAQQTGVKLMWGKVTERGKVIHPLTLPVRATFRKDDLPRI